MKICLVKLSTSFPTSSDAEFSPAAASALEPYLHLLDANSQQRISKFYRVADAQRCLIGRLLPRYYIAREFGLRWNSIVFEVTEHGRPYAVHAELPTTFDFNISHDSDLIVLAAVSKGEQVGVDVMRLENPCDDDETVDDLVRTISDQLTPLELDYIRHAPNDTAKLRRVFAFWTLKEAYAKAIGLGLRFDFKRVEFDLGGKEDQACSAATAKLDGIQLVQWEFLLLEPDEDYLMAVAIRGGADHLIPSSLTPPFISFVSFSDLITTGASCE